MKKLIEGNPALTDEHPVMLSEGALIYHKDSSKPAIDILLSPVSSWGYPSLFALDDDLDASWVRIEAMLDETVRQDLYPQAVPDTCDLVRLVRAHVELNNLYEEIRKPGQQVRLCVRNKTRYSMISKEVQVGISEFYPTSSWYIQIITDNANSYPTPMV